MSSSSLFSSVSKRLFDILASLLLLVFALPVIMAGIRTASVWVIGAATLSTPIGQTSLGNYIFSGLQTQNCVSVLFGCAAAALLAGSEPPAVTLGPLGEAERLN